VPQLKTPAERYRRLAAECLDVANNFPRGDHRDALLQMAVWQRLADQYEDAAPSFSASGRAAEQPTMQQQQQVQPDDDKKE
jgi:hypothetical protein